MTDGDIPAVFRQLVRLLNDAAIHRAAQVSLGDGLVFHRRELDIVLSVDDAPGISQSALAQRLGVTRAVVHKIVKALTEQNLVVVRTDGLDARKTGLFLSDAGKAVVKAHARYHEERDREFLDYLQGLEESERVVIADFLEQAVRYNQVF